MIEERYLNMKPSRGLLLAEMDPPPDKIGDILVPETSEAGQRPLTGTVIQAGSETRGEPGMRFALAKRVTDGSRRAVLSKWPTGAPRHIVFKEEGHVGGYFL